MNKYTAQQVIQMGLACKKCGRSLPAKGKPSLCYTCETCEELVKNHGKNHDSKNKRR